MVERTHLAPLRGVRSLEKLEKAELKAERDLVKAELGYPLYGGSLARAELAAEAAAADYVLLNGIRLPFYADAAVLRAMSIESLARARQEAAFAPWPCEDWEAVAIQL